MKRGRRRRPAASSATSRPIPSASTACRATPTRSSTSTTSSRSSGRSSATRRSCSPASTTAPTRSRCCRRLPTPCWPSQPTDRQAFGIADPDVDSVEITVELQTLKMDNMQSVSGRESYIRFYTTTRKFPAASAVFEDELVVPLEYRDCKVLKFGDPGDLGDLGVNQAELDALPQLVLPRARTIRLTLRAVCEDKPDYYGLEAPDPAFDTRFGQNDPVPAARGASRGRAGAPRSHAGRCAASSCSPIRPSSSTAIPAACCSARKWRRRPTWCNAWPSSSAWRARDSPWWRRRASACSSAVRSASATRFRPTTRRSRSRARATSPITGCAVSCSTSRATGPGTDWRIAAS